VLKLIFNNLVGYKEKASSTAIHPIFACRLVNKYWKYVADKIMEPATTTALEMELRGRSISDQNRVKTIQSLIPTMYVYTISDVIQENFEFQPEKIWCPSFFKEVNSNSFPFKSLKIVGVNQTRYFRRSEFFQVPVLKMITGWEFGHNLTSLVLCKTFRMSPYILKLLLQQTPNLKVLQISNVAVVLEDGEKGLEKEQFKLPPLNQLMVLKLKDNHVVVQPHGPSFCTVEVVVGW